MSMRLRGHAPDNGLRHQRCDMSDARLEPDISLPFPIEFVIRDTPRSHQGRNSKGKERWKQKVGEIAGTHVKVLREFYFIDQRPLALTIFYFPPTVMEGDVDNIVKLIADGMVAIIYPNDCLLERIIVQKFEPGVEAVFHSLTTTLERTVETDPPVVYIRIDDDLSWRELP